MFDLLTLANKTDPYFLYRKNSPKLKSVGSGSTLVDGIKFKKALCDFWTFKELFEPSFFVRDSNP